MTIQELCTDYYKDVYNYTYSLIRNVHDAEDLTQTVFLKCVKNKDKIPDNKSIAKRWVIAIARNTVRDYCGGRFWDEAVPIEFAEDLPDTASENFVGSMELRDALCRISKKRLNCIIRHYVNGETITSIGESHHTSRWQIARDMRAGLLSVKEYLKA